MKLMILAPLLMLPACATAPDPQQEAAVSLEAAPDPATAIPMIESAFRATLKDPDSAQFQWPNGFRTGWYQPPFGQRYYGWITCGTINAKNGYGGYSGPQAAIAVIRGGLVVKTDMDDGTGYGSVAPACEKIGIPAG